MGFKNVQASPGLSLFVDNNGQQILQANPRRLWLVIVNNGITECYLAFDQTPTPNAGVRINGSAIGGGFVMTSQMPYYGPISAICAAGNTTITVEEVSGDMD